MLVEVTRKPLRYAGKTYKVGDPIDMADRHGRLFITLGNVIVPKGTEAEDATEQPKRRYRRRDMRAE